ncbi:MAG: hypothetical protein AAF907_05870, partial [Planctomycetota bacterium]
LYSSRGGRRSRTEYAAGAVTVVDYDAGRELTVRPKDGFVTSSEAPERGLEMSQKFHESLFKDRSTAARPTTLDGKAVLKFELVPQQDAAAREVIWADAETRLPVRYEFGAGEHLYVLKDFDFSGDADDGRFNATLPEAVREDLARATPPDPFGDLPPNTYPTNFKAPPEPIDPASVAFGSAFGPGLSSEGLGPVRFGLSEDEVEAAVGVPCFSVTPGEFWLWIPSRSITARGTVDDGVVQVWVGAIMPQPLVLPFAGRTDGGVTVGMTGEEVEKRLGEPDVVEEFPKAGQPGYSVNGAGKPNPPSSVVRRYDDRRIGIQTFNYGTLGVISNAFVPSHHRVTRVFAWSEKIDPPPYFD